MSKRKDQLEIITQVFKKNANYEILLDRLKKSKKDFYFRKTNYMVSVVQMSLQLNCQKD